MKISIIAALASNRTIGRDNDLPWRLSPDLRRFKRLTLGHRLIFGRKTYDSIGRPLPGRHMIVVSRQRPGDLPEALHWAASPEDAVQVAQEAGESELFVGGGASLYRHFLPRADRLYLTHVHRDFEGDTHFPAYARGDWRMVAREDHAPRVSDGLAFSFADYERI